MINLTSDALVLGRFTLNDCSLELTRHEMALLHKLHSSGDAGNTLHDLTRYLWGSIKHTKTLGVHLLNLRRKLEKAGFGVKYYPSTERYVLGVKNDTPSV